MEDDRFGQYPFLYVIVGVDKCILIDTGCGTGNYKNFVDSHINKAGLPYLIINTHVHFDHVGGNHFFETSPGFLGTCLSGRNQVFTQNYELNSLAMAHHGAVLKPFKIDRWLNDGDLIYLNDANQTVDTALRVVYTPGHTPDSIALVLPCERRVFIGDSVYPFTAIHVDCLGSNPNDYFRSITALVGLVDQIEAALPPLEPILVVDDVEDIPSEQPSAQPPVEAAIAPAVEEPLDGFRAEVVGQFFDAVGLVPYQAREVFDVHALMAISDWDLETAVNTYLINSDAISALCPPTAPQQQQQQQTITAPSTDLKAPPPISELSISCGHVSESLPASAIRELHTALLQIKSGEIPPVGFDDGIAEYQLGTYTLLMPLDVQWDS